MKITIFAIIAAVMVLLFNDDFTARAFAFCAANVWAAALVVCLEIRDLRDHLAEKSKAEPEPRKKSIEEAKGEPWQIGT